MFSKFIKFIFLLGPIFSYSQEKKSLVNNFLDNYTIRDSYEDTLDFKTKNIFSVTKYKKPEKKDNVSKTINNLPFNMVSYTEYLKDGRKNLKKYVYDQIYRIEKFYYKSNLLILKEMTEDDKVFNYNWLFYNSENNIEEEIDYRIYGDNEFHYESYTKYNYATEQAKLKVEILYYGYDSLANQKEEYLFEFPFLTKKTPLYKSKAQKYQLINGQYKPIDIKNYVIENRDVTFNYDKNGYLLLEIWYKNHNLLENKTEYEYSDDYKERIEQQYHMLGTEKSTKTTRKYDDYGNLIFEQSIEYTGNPLSKTFYEYQYDKYGNWIEKKTYNQESDHGNYGKKELINYEYREIKYYNENQKPQEFILPEFHKNANLIRTNIPKISVEKQNKIDEFQNAVKTGNFDNEILKKQANSLEEFTPKYWTLKDKAFGDLDDSPEDEAVCVYETPIEGDLGFAQCLAIYKKEGNLWKLWHQTTQPILSTKHGGMMGNPYDGISIKNKTIIVNHFGGSRQKWNYTHRYRFQNNNWYLIGATVNFGAPCDYFESLDYNLSTGNAIFEHSSENCENENNIKNSSWKEKINKKIALPLMDDFEVGENIIELKKRQTEMYY